MTNIEFKEIILKHFPVVEKLEQRKAFSLDSIYRFFESKYNREGVYIKSNSLFSLIGDVENRIEDYSFSLYKIAMFNGLLRKLEERLSDVQIKKLKISFEDFFKGESDNHLNRIGEFAALFNTIHYEYNELLDVEYQVSSSRSKIDFRFKDNNRNDTFLLEVSNIHLKNDRIEDNDEAIKTFLTRRVEKKRAEKLISERFIISLILWGDIESLKIYSKFYNINSFKISDTYEPITIVLEHKQKNYECFIVGISKYIEMINGNSSFIGTDYLTGETIE